MPCFIGRKPPHKGMYFLYHGPPALILSVKSRPLPSFIQGWRPNDHILGTDLKYRLWLPRYRRRPFSPFFCILCRVYPPHPFVPAPWANKLIPLIAPRKSASATGIADAFSWHFYKFHGLLPAFLHQPVFYIAPLPCRQQIIGFFRQPDGPCLGKPGQVHHFGLLFPEKAV